MTHELKLCVCYTPHTEPELLLYIANATYVAAMAARAKAQAAAERASSGIASAGTLAMPVAHQFVECINTLSKLLQLTPENLHAWCVHEDVCVFELKIFADTVGMDWGQKQILCRPSLIDESDMNCLLLQVLPRSGAG